jgi:hypothetical protein
MVAVSAIECPSTSYGLSQADADFLGSVRWAVFAIDLGQEENELVAGVPTGRVVTSYAR